MRGEGLLVVLRALFWLSFVAALLPRAELPPLPRAVRPVAAFAAAIRGDLIVRLAALKAQIAADADRRANSITHD